MDLFPIIILGITLILNIVLSIFVLKNNPKGATNRIYFFLAIVVSMWITAMYWDSIPPFSVWHERLTFFLATPMNISFFLLAYTLPETQFKLSKNFFSILAILGVVIMILMLSPFAVSSIAITGADKELISGPAMILFGLSAFFLDGGSVYLLFKKFRKSTGKEHEQFRYVMYGIFSMFGLIITTIFIPAVFFKNSSFVPLAPFYGMFFLGMTAYAIIRHQFLDIRLILARAIAFLIFIFLCAGVYSVIIFLFIQKFLHLRVDFFTASSALIIAVFAAITYQPLLKKITNITNRFFFKGNYDSNKLLSALSHIMTNTIDLQYMTKSILNLLVKEMRLVKGAFLIIENDKVKDVIGVNYKKTLLSSQLNEKLFKKAFKSKINLIFEDLQEGELKDIFRKYEISIVIKIQVESGNVALLVLGNKLSGEIYNVRDLNLLNIFSSESGIAIQHAKDYARISKFNLELEKKVQERTKTLHQQNKEIAALLSEKSKLLAQQANFLTLAGHEIQAPLSMAVLRANNILSKNKEKGMEDDLEEINKILKKLKGLMDKLMDTFK